ncbi:MAG: DUF1330 domain-containing protein [Kordiimonadaceae bacterium]|jgi:uncharacterized protein (DUF1330 family)|nr:DUF1330 domain-containing protein [Kordiimonadaceae bacterium]MBT6033264.1 DUF1330 domain-containing protein [Kordiimonadaceae bacterium]
MTGYLILDIEIYDFEEFQSYAQQVKYLVEDSTGKYIFRGGNVENIVGDWQPSRLVIVEFPTVAEARELFNSARYKPLREMAQNSSNMNAIVVEGYDF